MPSSRRRRLKSTSRLALFKVGAVLFVVGGLYLLFRTPASKYMPAALPYLKAPKTVVVPVEGLTPQKVVSTWHAPRSGGRKHEGVDLFAPRGTNVLSATRGVVWKVGWDSLGGNVVWVLGDGPALYYYAHLDRIAPGLRRGDDVRAGTVLGTVGNTGNARRTPPHLHFGVYSLRWTGVYAVDPVPLLAKKGLFMPAPVPLEPEPAVASKSTATRVAPASARSSPKTGTAASRSKPDAGTAAVGRR